MLDGDKYLELMGLGHCLRINSVDGKESISFKTPRGCEAYVCIYLTLPFLDYGSFLIFFSLFFLFSPGLLHRVAAKLVTEDCKEILESLCGITVDKKEKGVGVC